MCAQNRGGEASHTTWKEITGAEFLPEAGDDREGLHNGKMTEVKGNQFRVEEKFRTLNHMNLLYFCPCWYTVSSH